ncbi:MAG: peptidoglycan DD-metalloendopeptidase family protein [Micropruina sp.]|uniref:peptidoglycan DD-metalloendopeptidase family protein n=1 Tax=Micropruina sp. TaxID=2737536 RepID=UPI0039E4AE6D
MSSSRRQKASPTFVRRLLVAVLGAGLSVALVSPAQAEDGKDRSDLQRAIVSSKAGVAESRAEVSQALRNLAKAQAAQAKAQRKLTAANRAVSDARALDAAIGRRLDVARSKLAAARKAVQVAKAEVDEQLRLMGEAAREAFQQRTDLVGLTVLFDSADTGDLSQRLQWSTTVLDAAGVQVTRLRQLQATLEDAERAQAAVEKQIADDKAEAEANLARLKVLQAKASAAKQAAAASVVKLAKARKAAEADLRAEREQHRKLLAREASISAQIRRRAQKAGKRSGVSGASSAGFIRPVNGSVGSPFGLRYHPILHTWRMHRGTDFNASCGTPIYAAAKGRVASAAPQGGFGNYVVIDHGFIKGRYVSTGYAHQSRMVVHAGQQVGQGQLIGYVGTTGLSTGCHLHFQVYVNGGVVNPMAWL